MPVTSGNRKSAEAILQEVAAGTLAPHRAARKLFYHSGDIDAAMTLARDTFRQRPRAAEHEEIGNLYLQSGDDFLARAVYRAGLLKYGALHSTNLIHADVPVARAFVDDAHRLLYIPIPKCASSTIKNYLSDGLTGETHKEKVHRKLLRHYRYVTPQDLQTRYKSYFKFVVVRDPVDRVVSYFTRNICTGAIHRSAYRLAKFRGLPTRPSAREFVTHFDRYRRYFLGVRHHTDAQIKYIAAFLQPQTGLQVFGMGGVATIRARLSETFAKPISDGRFMVSDDKSAAQERDPIWETLRAQYAEDMALFAPLLAQDGDPTQAYALSPPSPPRAAFFQEPSRPAARARRPEKAPEAKDRTALESSFEQPD